MHQPIELPAVLATPLFIPILQQVPLSDISDNTILDQPSDHAIQNFK